MRSCRCVAGVARRVGRDDNVLRDICSILQILVAQNDDDYAFVFPRVARLTGVFSTVCEVGSSSSVRKVAHFICWKSLDLQLFWVDGVTTHWQLSPHHHPCPKFGVAFGQIGSLGVLPFRQRGFVPPPTCLPSMASLCFVRPVDTSACASQFAVILHPRMVDGSSPSCLQFGILRQS